MVKNSLSYEIDAFMRNELRKKFGGEWTRQSTYSTSATEKKSFWYKDAEGREVKIQGTTTKDLTYELLKNAN